MPPIVLSKITRIQKLIILKGLVDYEFIMKYWKTDGPDFEKVYYNFYLTAERFKYSNPVAQKIYFERLLKTKPTDSLLDIIKDIGGNDFVVASKLLHTVNPNKPIYDSKVRKYLIAFEGVKLYKHPYNLTTIEKDWKLLKGWYTSFLPSKRAKSWIQWFDKEFPAYSHISDVKKIDFIIYATQ